MNRLCSGKQAASDEGFANLVDDPPSVAELAAFFRELRDAIEIELAQSDQ